MNYNTMIIGALLYTCRLLFYHIATVAKSTVMSSGLPPKNFDIYFCTLFFSSSILNLNLASINLLIH